MVKATIASRREIDNFIKNIIKFKTSYQNEDGQASERLQATLRHTVDQYLMSICTIEEYQWTGAHCPAHVTPSNPSHQWVTQIKADDVKNSNDEGRWTKFTINNNWKKSLENYQNLIMKEIDNN